MYERRVNKKELFGTHSQNKGDDKQFCRFQLHRVKGSLLKLSSSSAVFTLTTKLTQWLSMVHVTAQWIHLFTQTGNCTNRAIVHHLTAVVNPPEHLTQSQRGWVASSLAGCTSLWVDSSSPSSPFVEAANVLQRDQTSCCKTLLTKMTWIVWSWIAPAANSEVRQSRGFSLT